MSMTIAQYTVKLLHRAGVKRIWGITGDSLNGLVDSLRADGTIDWIGVRHEEVAAFAAGAEAEISGELAVCAGSCGPGNMHLINGLYNCYRDRVPVLAIAADIPSAEDGSCYFQETDPKSLFSGCSVFCEKVTSPEQMPRMMEAAVRQAILQSNVSVIILPGDIALKHMPEDTPDIKWPTLKPATAMPDADLIQQAADLLNDQGSVALFCGAGCQGAHAEVMALAQALSAPVVYAMRGKEFIEYDNPYDVGMTGLLGYESGYQALENADAVVLLGTSFPYKAFYPQKARMVQIDRDPNAIGRHVQVDLGIVSNVIPAINALLPKLTPKTDDKFLKLCQEHYQKSRKKLDSMAKNKHHTDRVHPQSLVKMISEKAADNAIFTCDVGTPTLWSARYFQTNGKRRLIGSFNHGSMANALAQSLGAQMLDKQRQVIAFCGDGGFSMLMGDLLTLLPYHLPVKVVILNNSSLALVDMEMKVAGFVSDATNLVNPSFAAIARACGINSYLLKDPDQLETMVSAWLNETGPSVLEVITDRHELSMPPHLTMAYVKGFSLYALKAIFNGHGDELIELAKVNLYR